MGYKTKQNLLQKIAMPITLIGIGVLGGIRGGMMLDRSSQDNNFQKYDWFKIDKQRMETPGYNSEREIREDLLTNINYLKENTVPHFDSKEKTRNTYRILESLAKKVYLKEGDKIFEGDRNTHLPPSISEAKQSYLFSTEESREDMRNNYQIRQSSRDGTLKKTPWPNNFTDGEIEEILKRNSDF